MIQEKDFLYRVPVKNVFVTAPGKQVRNPEILVDLEGGEFMYGDILDANSANKLIDQSVKDAIDNSIENSNCVTKDLLEAETSARTKSDEDLNAKIKAEQTRAEGKEKEISDKLVIVDGDSNTEGSFRKAIADVIAAAPEDLDTLKEIADKLAGNDDLHTALNQAITEKADASALANEVTRATGAESGLQTAIDTKADATALITLEQKVTANTTAIEGKQDEGNYVTYSSEDSDNYYFHKGFTSSVPFAVDDSDGNEVEYGINGITSSNHSNCLATSDGTFKPISDFASAGDVSSLRVGLSKKQDKITVNSVDVTDIETADITKLRTIVINLIDALSTSGLIRTNKNLE